MIGGPWKRRKTISRIECTKHQTSKSLYPSCLLIQFRCFWLLSRPAFPVDQCISISWRPGTRNCFCQRTVLSSPPYIIYTIHQHSSKYTWPWKLLWAISYRISAKWGMKIEVSRWDLDRTLSDTKLYMQQRMHSTCDAIKSVAIYSFLWGKYFLCFFKLIIPAACQNPNEVSCTLLSR